MFRVSINSWLKLVILLPDCLWPGCEGRLERNNSQNLHDISLFSLEWIFPHSYLKSTLLMWIGSWVKETRFFCVKFCYETTICIKSILISKKKKMLGLMWAFLFLVLKHMCLKQFVSDCPNKQFLVYVMFDHVTEVPLSTCVTTSYLRCNSVGKEHFTLKKHVTQNCTYKGINSRKRIIETIKQEYQQLQFSNFWKG